MEFCSRNYALDNLATGFKPCTCYTCIIITEIKPSNLNKLLKHSIQNHCGMLRLDNVVLSSSVDSADIFKFVIVGEWTWLSSQPRCCWAGHSSQQSTFASNPEEIMGAVAHRGRNYCVWLDLLVTKETQLGRYCDQQTWWIFSLFGYWTMLMQPIGSL